MFDNKSMFIMCIDCVDENTLWKSIVEVVSLCKVRRLWVLNIESLELRSIDLRYEIPRIDRYVDPMLKVARIIIENVVRSDEAIRICMELVRIATGLGIACKARLNTSRKTCHIEIHRRRSSKDVDSAWRGIVKRLREMQCEAMKKGKFLFRVTAQDSDELLQCTTFTLL